MTYHAVKQQWKQPSLPFWCSACRPIPPYYHSRQKPSADQQHRRMEQKPLPSELGADRCRMNKADGVDLDRLPISTKNVARADSAYFRSDHLCEGIHHPRYRCETCVAAGKQRLQPKGVAAIKNSWRATPTATSANEYISPVQVQCSSVNAAELVEALFWNGDVSAAWHVGVLEKCGGILLRRARTNSSRRMSACRQRKAANRREVQYN